MTFLIALSAYIVGWVLCNTFLFALIERIRGIDKKQEERVQAIRNSVDQLTEIMADFNKAINDEK